MDLQSYIDEIKLVLTGGLLDLELEDDKIVAILNSSLRELQRYICTTKYETIPFSDCIDLSPRKINSVVRIFRTTATGSSTGGSGSAIDPAQISMWQMMGTGNINNMNNYISNYITYQVARQIRNTLSTDLAFRYDHEENKLYINTSGGSPSQITIEYVPRFESVEDIKSDYWIDILMRLSIAKTKIIVGRIRSKFTQSNALWQLDGPALLAEGNQEITELRQKLQDYSQIVYPID